MCEGMFTMFDLDPAVLNAFIALIGVLLLVFAWRSVSGLPALARWGLRLVLTAIIVAPFAALILYPPAMQEARAPTDRDRAAPSARVEPEQPLQPETDVGERAGDDATARKQADEARRNATSEKSARRDILVEMMNEKTGRVRLKRLHRPARTVCLMLANQVGDRVTAVPMAPWTACRECPACPVRAERAETTQVLTLRDPSPADR